VATALKSHGRTRFSYPVFFSLAMLPVYTQPLNSPRYISQALRSKRNTALCAMQKTDFNQILRRPLRINHVHLHLAMAITQQPLTILVQFAAANRAILCILQRLLHMPVSAFIRTPRALCNVAVDAVNRQIAAITKHPIPLHLWLRSRRILTKLSQRLNLLFQRPHKFQRLLRGLRINTKNLRASLVAFLIFQNCVV